MLYVLQKNGIALTRGDTARILVSIENVLTSEDCPVGENDVLTLTVKKTVNDKDAIFQKTVTGTNLIHIEPSDTSGMEFGKYKYDVQLTRENGDVYTVIEPSVFEVLAEVTC